MKTPTFLRPPVRGVTLVECAITLAVAAIAVGAAAPGFVQARDRRHLEGAAAQLETDIQLARSAAVARGASVRMSFASGGGAGCYVVHTGHAGDCACNADGSASCAAGAEALRTVRLADAGPIRVTANVASMVFDAAKGTVTPTATIRVQGAGGAIHEIVNVMGRVRSCSPAPAVAGHVAC